MKDDIIIDPRREANEPEIPSGGLLFVNPGDIAKASKLLKEHNPTQQFLYNSNLFVTREKEDGSFFTAGPSIGAPMAVLVLEKLIALGATQIIVYGTCGALDSTLKIGDILLPTWGISEEGTSTHYPVDQPPQSDESLRKRLHSVLSRNEISTSEGPVWTTDAPYRESRAAICKYVSEGVLAVDMEFTALCTVASFRNVQIAFAMLVSDELYHSRWKSGFGSKNFKRKNNEMIESLIDILSYNFQETE